MAELAEVPGNSRTEDGEPYGALPDVEVDEVDRSFSYASPIPVFYGHYWRTDVPVEHEDWTPTTACVDFSAVKGGRWSPTDGTGSARSTGATTTRTDATSSNDRRRPDIGRLSSTGIRGECPGRSGWLRVTVDPETQGREPGDHLPGPRMTSGPTRIHRRASDTGDLP